MQCATTGGSAICTDPRDQPRQLLMVSGLNPGRWRGMLFDLDGTLADTAPDLAAAANAMRIARGIDALPLEVLRPAMALASTASGICRA